MNHGKERKTFFEYQLIKDESIIREIEELVEKFDNLKKCLTRRQYGIKFRHYTGIIQTQNYQIEILPKIWNSSESQTEDDINNASKNFIKIFSYSIPKEKLLEHGAELSTKEDDTNILEFLINLYSLSLSRELENGLYRSYMREKINSSFLNGKIDLKKQINSIDESKFNITRFLLTSDNHLNRFFSHNTDLFTLLSSNEAMKRSLSIISRRFRQELSVQMTPDNKKIFFNRLNERFEPAYNYANLVTNNLTPFSNFDLKSMMFLYDMNYIFESFIYNFLNENKSAIFPNPDETEVQFQISAKNFIHSDDFHRFTRPDITISISGKIALIVDAKYKIIEKNRLHEDLEDERDEIERVSSSDFYQMYVYSSIHKADVLMVFPSKNVSDLDRPYKFLGPSDDQSIWISWWCLDFASKVWEESLIEFMSTSIEKILNSINGGRN